MCWHITGTVSQVLHNVYQTRVGVRSTRVAPRPNSATLGHYWTCPELLTPHSLSRPQLWQSAWGNWTSHSPCWAGAAVSWFRTISVCQRPVHRLVPATTSITAWAESKKQVRYQHSQVQDQQNTQQFNLLSSKTVEKLVVLNLNRQPRILW